MQQSTSPSWNTLHGLPWFVGLTGHAPSVLTTQFEHTVMPYLNSLPSIRSPPISPNALTDAMTSALSVSPAPSAAAVLIDAIVVTGTISKISPDVPPGGSEPENTDWN